MAQYHPQSTGVFMGGATEGRGGIGGKDRLTDAKARSARPDATIYKLTDGEGMYLAIMPNGAKLWRLKYRHAGKERVYSIGAYPAISIAAARKERARAREWLRAGKDPTIERRVVRANEGAEQATTFGVIANEWLLRQGYAPGSLKSQRKRLDSDLLPYLGSLPIKDIGTPIVLETLRRIERRGALETAAKCRRITSQIFRYAIQTARAKEDPVVALKGAIATPDTRHRATVSSGEMPALFAALAAVPAERNTKLALYWLILTAARTIEMRFATWAEIEDRRRWRVPAERMKMRREHVVPLSEQARRVLDLAATLRTTDDPSALLFPGFTRHGALSENALLTLLARAGFYGRQTSHGFRALFSTWAHEEREADPDVIEACLAHVKQGVRGVYNRSSYLSRRLELLQAWATQCAAWGMKLS
jgi:integrase